MKNLSEKPPKANTRQQAAMRNELALNAPIDPRPFPAADIARQIKGLWARTSKAGIPAAIYTGLSDSMPPKGGCPKALARVLADPDIESECDLA